MRIATWNINGIKARLPLVQAWLKESAPDAAVLQELKSTDETFPKEAIEECGYTIETHGQKSFNGVAILSKNGLEDVSRGLPGDDDDEQARWIEGTVIGEAGTVRLCGLYLPNGNPTPGPKYDYKLAWMARMEARVEALLDEEQPTVFAGDYNAIPEPRDAMSPKAWEGDALYLSETRDAWRRLLNLGLHDATREVSQADETFTFWDYQGGAWDRNHGIRIDHMLLSPQAADRLTGSGIEAFMRGREKPSDHVPVWIDLAI